jgi:hypothetical protein
MWTPFYDTQTELWLLYDEQNRREHPARFNFEPSTEEINGVFPIELYVEDRFKTVELPSIPDPEVFCDIYVSASHETRNKYLDLFCVELKPKGLVFPEDFFIARGISTAKSVEEYIAEGEDYFSGSENWFWIADDSEEEELIIKPLPYPFNNREAYVVLKWTAEDVHFEDEAKTLWQMYQHKYGEAELQAKTVDELKLIARAKDAKAYTKKDDIISAILTQQGDPDPTTNTQKEDFSWLRTTPQQNLQVYQDDKHTPKRADEHETEIEASYASEHARVVSKTTYPKQADVIEKDLVIGENGWEGMAHSFPSWVKFDCPKCGRYNSNSFLFTLERDKTEYMGYCAYKDCRVAMRIKVPLALNNKIYDKLEADNKEFLEYCDMVYKAKKKYPFIVVIRKPAWEGYKYSLQLDGRNSGCSTEARTKEEALQIIRDQFKEWEERHSPDLKPLKVTDKTLFFHSFTPDITKQEVLHQGQKSLSAFFG